MKFRLNEELKDRKLSQTKLARDLGATQQTINAYVLGKAEPSLENLCKIADYLHVTTDELLGRETNLINIASLDEKTQEVIRYVLNMPASEVDKLLNVIKIVKS